MKTGITLLSGAMLLCVAACSSGNIYFNAPNTDTVQGPLTGTTTGGPANANDPNTPAPDLSTTPLQAPGFQPTIDGDVFTPAAVYYATGQDPQNHPVFMLVVSDQNNFCDQITTAKQLTPGASTLALYLYSVDGAAGMTTPTDSDYAGTYAVFNDSVPNGDVGANPSLDIPTDTGLYASGNFFALDAACAKTRRHQVGEGSVNLSIVDVTHAKASGSIAALLDNNVALNANGAFVAQACPALLTLPTAVGCKLP